LSIVNVTWFVGFTLRFPATSGRENPWGMAGSQMLTLFVKPAVVPPMASRSTYM